MMPIVEYATAVSPNGKASAGVVSDYTDDGRGISQIIVQKGAAGSGVGCVYAPLVPMKLEFVSDHRLRVLYPEGVEVIPSPVNKCPFLIEIEFVETTDELPTPPGRTEASETKADKAVRLDRGVLHINAQGNHRYSYYDVREPDSSLEALLARGWQGGGPTWMALIAAAIEQSTPHIAATVSFDDEAEGVSVLSDDESALREVAALVVRLKADPDYFEAMVARAEQLELLE